MTIATIDLLQAKAARRRKRTGKIVVAVPSRSHTESTPWTRSPGQSRECPLCLHSLSRPACAPCGHTFCWRCISAWVADEEECPLCRSRLPAQSIRALHCQRV
mmetsp:Transcript_46892/g.120930  ORF Transcript_46892/g.120930 Transcript_46892/m.120930 type:complete len:103 (-) Transcript_46892:1370-1678(-)